MSISLTSLIFSWAEKKASCAPTIRPDAGSSQSEVGALTPESDAIRQLCRCTSGSRSDLSGGEGGGGGSYGEGGGIECECGDRENEGRMDDVEGGRGGGGSDEAENSGSTSMVRL